MEKCISIMYSRKPLEYSDVFLHDVSMFNFFIRSTVTSFIEATCKEFRDRSADGLFKYEITEHSTTFHMIGQKNGNDTVIIVTTEKPPHNHLVCLAYEINKNGLKQNIKENFNYISGEMKIRQIENEIQEIKLTMIDNIDKVMNRGEKLEDLLQKTQYLQAESKKMLEGSKALNSRCCIIL